MKNNKTICEKGSFIDDVFGEELDTSISLPETVAKNFSYNSEYDVYVEYGGFETMASNGS